MIDSAILKNSLDNFVAQAIERARVKGVSIAPPAVK